MRLVALCILLFFLSPSAEATEPSNQTSGLDYGVVYDAGSVHTTVSVYAWSKRKLNGTGVVREIASCEIPVDRGISSFYPEPRSVKEYILDAKCLPQGKYTYAVWNMLTFLDPFPYCPHLVLIYIIESTQLPFLRLRLRVIPI